MTLKNGFGKCSLFVLSANGWKDQDKASSFSRQKKTLIWRRHCSIGHSCCSMTSKRSFDWFLESSRALSFFSRAFAKPTNSQARCIRSINQSNCSISVRLLFPFCWRLFISRSYKNRSIVCRSKACTVPRFPCQRCADPCKCLPF